jgi:hypothetical protein
MVMLFAAGGTVPARTASLLSDANVLHGWTNLHRAATGADCVVLFLPWIRADDGRLHIAELRRQRTTPVVLVTHRDADNLREICAIGVDEVVWLSEVDRHLSAAVQRAAGRGYRSRVATALRQARHIPPLLRDALAHAAEREQPARSLRELATLAHCDRSTLWYHWRRTVGTATGLRPEDFMDWFLLLHAVAHKLSGCTWPHAAEAVGVHPHTVSRIAKRLLGSTLRDLARCPQAHTVQVFEATILKALLTPATIDLSRRRSPNVTALR